MEYCKFDAVSRTLTISEGFRKEMQNMESSEFRYYSEMVATIPGLQVIQRTHRSPRKYTTKSGETFNCNPGKNLKYENMENFIAGLPNSSQYMHEYNFLKKHASVVQTSRYKLVKDWFVTQFPEFRTNPLAYILNAPAPVDAKQFAASAAATTTHTPATAITQ